MSALARPALVCDVPLLSIDPGLDDVRLAVWRAPSRGAGSLLLMAPSRRLDFLERVDRIVTDPAQPLAARLVTIIAGVRTLVLRESPRAVYVEEPAIAGTYRRHGGGQQGSTIAHSMPSFHMALGAILVGALTGGCAPTTVKAPSGKGNSKADRHARLEAYATACPRWKGRIPRNGDVRDAIITGLIAPWPA